MLQYIVGAAKVSGLLLVAKEVVPTIEESFSFSYPTVSVKIHNAVKCSDKINNKVITELARVGVTTIPKVTPMRSLVFFLFLILFLPANSTYTEHQGRIQEFSY